MPDNTSMEDMDMTINDCVNSKQKSCFQLHPIIFMILAFFSTIEERTDKEMEKS